MQSEAATKLFGVMVLAIVAEVETEPLPFFLAFLPKPLTLIRAFVAGGVANRALTFIDFHLLSPLARLYALVVELFVSASLLRIHQALKLFAANTLDFPFGIFLLPRLGAFALFSVTLLDEGAVKFPTSRRRFAFAVIAVVSHLLSLLMRLRAQLNYLRAALRLPTGAPGLRFSTFFKSDSLMRHCFERLSRVAGNLPAVMSAWMRVQVTPRRAAASAVLIFIFALLVYLAGEPFIRFRNRHYFIVLAILHHFHVPLLLSSASQRIAVRPLFKFLVRRTAFNAVNIFAVSRFIRQEVECRTVVAYAVMSFVCHRLNLLQSFNSELPRHYIQLLSFANSYFHQRERKTNDYNLLIRRSDAKFRMFRIPPESTAPLQALS